MNHFDPFLKSHREAAAKRSSFEQQGRDDKAAKMLAVLDRACKCCGLPVPAGERGVEFVMSLPETAMLAIRVEAKLDRPPSSETFGALLELVRERSAS